MERDAEKKEIYAHSSQNLFTYVLTLADGCFYVGRTSDIERRLREHFTGRGARWLGAHPPRGLLEAFACDCERAQTLQMMRKHGWEKVRGGPWCQVRLSRPPKDLARSCDDQEKLLESKKMSTTQIQESNVDQWFVQPPQKNAHGGQYWAITITKDSRAHPRIQVGGDNVTLRAPFGLATYSEGGRMSLDLSVPPWLSDIKDFFQKMK